MPSPADAAALQSVLADLSTLTIRDVVELWRRYSDNPDFRVIVEAALPEIVGQYAAAGALASAQWYDEMAPGLDYRAVPVVDLPAERFTKTIGWALYAPGQATPLDRMAGAAQRIVFDASRQTVLANLDTEYGSAPEVGTRWARYASATACGFCRMLATRKAVYRSAESATRVVGRSTELTISDRRMRAAGLATTDELLARRDVYERNTRWGSKGEKKIKALHGNASRGSRYHDNCRCVAVPVRPGQSYEPPDYVARWEDEYLAARDAGARTPGEIAAAMDKAEGARRAPKTRSRADQAAPATDTGTDGPKPPLPPLNNSSAASSDGWSEEERSQRQDALGINTHGENLERHEIEFVERFQRADQQLEWIPRDRRTFKPTNDFRWTNNGDIEVELKRTKPRYATIHGRIVDAVSRAAKHAFEKPNFMIDIGDEPLSDTLRAELAEFNVGRRKHRIVRLWVMSGSDIHAIELRE